MYLHPAHVNDRLIDDVAARARGAVSRHAGPARRRRRARTRCGAAITARRMKDVIARLPRRDPWLDGPHHRARRLPRRDRARAFDNLLAFVEDVAFDRLGVFTYSVGGRHAGGATWRIRCRPRSWPSAPRSSRRPRTGWPGRARRRSSARARPCWWTGRARIPRFPSRDGWPARRPRSTASCCCATAALTPGRFADVSIVEVDGYELVGE